MLCEKCMNQLQEDINNHNVRFMRNLSPFNSDMRHLREIACEDVKNNIDRLQCLCDDLKWETRWIAENRVISFVKWDD